MPFLSLYSLSPFPFCSSPPLLVFFIILDSPEKDLSPYVLYKRQPPFAALRLWYRKSRFMKWLSKLFKVGHSNRRFSAGGEQPQSFGNENTAWRAPVKSLDGRSRANKEKEELDRAIALSLAEDLKKPNGYKWRMESDEDLAKKVNDGFGSAPYPSYASKGHRLCGGCEREIVYGNYLGCMGMFYHPECFRCRACDYPITEREFSLSGRDAYHKSCFKELTHPKCEVCHQFSWNTRYISLGDGRRICLECMESAIMDTGDCQPLYHSIRDFYEGMNMRIDQQIPMLLVERHALNEAIEGEKHGFHQMPETRGLCLSEEQTVTSVRKRPRMERSGLVGIRTQPEKLIRRCEVTAILVLYGLPSVADWSNPHT
ncbi:hypothetical protein OROMI_006931 [Orobanche minor]